jgi:hypothetical protein
VNTQENPNGYINFEYNSDNLSGELLFYDGVSLQAKASLGNLVYVPEFGQKEIFKAESISLHYPSEHYVTM